MPRLGFSSFTKSSHDDNHHHHNDIATEHNNQSNSHLNMISSPHSNVHIASPSPHSPSSSPMGHSHSRRSFFGLSLGKTSSSESTYSITSEDNNHNHNHNHNQNQNQNHNHNTNNYNQQPASSNNGHPSIQRNGSSSMVQLKKFFRPARKNSNDHIHSPSPITSSSSPNIRRGSNIHMTHSINNSSSNLTQNLLPKSLSSLNNHYKASPIPSTSSTPTFTHDANNNMIVKTDQKFWDDLEGSVTKKYGKLGKVLGSGAGGSVRLIVRESDGVTFAVKEFVPRRANESVKEYAKKCTAEFCIGSTLHHPNIIQTLDIINENNHFFEVMEYAPIDFFAVVMSGQMTRSEINCCFKQITLGVSYLHSVGLSHRDLKLDNCVVTKDGIVKLIDFGSAVVFKYPFEDDIVLAHGIVGSDPYLAPEVLTSTNNYDPQFVDIWSIAIIYCCMTLRRFPWKAPKNDDPSFSLYCMEDDQPHDYFESAKKHKELLIERKRKILQIQKEREEKEKEREKEKENNEPVSLQNLAINEQRDTQHDKDEEKLLGDPMKMAIAPKTDEIINSKESSSPVPESKVPESAAAEQYIEGSSKTEEPVHKHHHHHHHQDTGNNNNDNNDKTSATPQSTEIPERRTASNSKSQKQIHGPYRLMRLLPHASRPIISKMLSVDISSRATIKAILDDEWFNEIKYCTVNTDGKTINDIGHNHTIV